MHAPLQVRSADEEDIVNARMKKRLIIVTGVIVIVMAIILAVVGGNSSAKTVSLAQATSGEVNNERIQVTGNVVEDSYSVDGNVLSFDIYDPDNADTPTLHVLYDGAAASTFGNDVTAICTGKIDDDGVMRAGELVTKCPSKYRHLGSAFGVPPHCPTADLRQDRASWAPWWPAARMPQARATAMVADTDDPSQVMSVKFDGARFRRNARRQGDRGPHGRPYRNGKFSATDIALQG